MLEKSILLIGLGTNKYNLNKIVEVPDLITVKSRYGENSCFFNAYKTLNRFNKINNIFILNLDTWEDVKDQDSLFEDMNFDYICPLDLKLDDIYFDSFYNRNLTYSQLLLLMLHNSISTMIISGLRASSYETLDAYLDAEILMLDRTEERFSNLRKENLMYVANNLKSYEYPNVVLAALMTTTDYAEYPGSSLLGEVIFDIENVDVPQRLIYFKNSYLTGTTVENLVTFSRDTNFRIGTVNRILKYFYFHNANLDKFLGKPYSEYTKVLIQDEIEKWLEGLKGWIIYDYSIKEIIQLSAIDGGVSINTKFEIKPKFTTEVITLTTKL
jgi:hypothetical protein